MLHVEPGESTEAFRSRIRADTEADGAEYIVIGGLPDM